MTSAPEKIDALRRLYPTLTEEDLREAEANLRRYFEIVWEIQSERCSSTSEGQFDSARPSPMIKERSNVSLKG